jgi:hypothetical protein
VAGKIHSDTINGANNSWPAAGIIRIDPTIGRVIIANRGVLNPKKTYKASINIVIVKNIFLPYIRHVRIFTIGRKTDKTVIPIVPPTTISITGSKVACSLAWLHLTCSTYIWLRL